MGEVADHVVTPGGETAPVRLDPVFVPVWPPDAPTNLITTRSKRMAPDPTSKFRPAWRGRPALDATGPGKGTPGEGGTASGSGCGCGSGSAEGAADAWSVAATAPPQLEQNLTPGESQPHNACRTPLALFLPLKHTLHSDHDLSRENTAAVNGHLKVPSFWPTESPHPLRILSPFL